MIQQSLRTPVTLLPSPLPSATSTAVEWAVLPVEDRDACYGPGDLDVSPA